MSVSELRLRQGIELMREIFPKPPYFSPKKTQLWGYLFSDWSDEQFARACTNAAKTLTFFPSPGELRNLEEKCRQEQTTLAWEAVRSAVRRFSPYGSIGVADVMHDGQALWSLERMTVESVMNMTTENRAIRAAEFRRLYDAAIFADLATQWLPGLFELQNRGNENLTPAMIGRPDLKELPEHCQRQPELPTRDLKQLAFEILKT